MTAPPDRADGAAEAGDGTATTPTPPGRLVPMAFVADCERAVAFWARLGFGVRNRYLNETDGRLNWAWLEAADGAALMVARATAPVAADAQAVLFYLYVADVAAWRAELAAAGVTATEIETPEHSPNGEFRITDPDGYVVYVRQVD